MGNIDVVKAFLDSDDWKYEDVEDYGVRMRYGSEDGAWRVYIVAAEDGVITVDSVLDQAAPERRRPEVAELLTRASYGNRIGGFQFDYSDGEIRYHTAIDVEGGELAPLMVKNLLYANVMTMERYFPAVMAVCYANVDALSALLHLEDG